MIDVIKILENQQKQRDTEAELKIFSLSQLSRLNKLIEQNNGYITNHLWELLLFNVNDLYIKDGKVGYKTFSKTPSKKIMSLLKQYNNIIIDNFSYIMTGK